MSSESQKTCNVRYIQVDAEHQDQRLDNFLLAQLKGIPKSLVYRIIRSGEVRVNRGRIRVNYRVQSGDSIRLPPMRLVTSETVSVNAGIHQLQWLEQAILYEDSHLLVINKPSGMAVHGGSGTSYGIIEALRVLRTDTLELAHRLDRDTSGCLIVTKRRSALRSLHQTMRDGSFTKHYLALVSGKLDRFRVNVEVPLVKNILKSGERIVQVDQSGRSARTVFQRQRAFDGVSLVEVLPYNGRTHQIRVHAAHIGLPIVGDDKYGNKAVNAELRKTTGLKRLFLHAAKVQIPSLGDGPSFEVIAPLDSALESCLQRLASRK
ncbi:hypothetical protein TI04_02605 [Achromatium sp. WMS2]|nr:hypothetical protein TI04_02605 [Achromatium sp. WMS2]